MTDRVTAGDVVEAVEEAHRDGVTDGLEGGVPKPEIADRVDRQAKSKRLTRILNHLVEDGQLVKVWGINPKTRHSRQSFLPPEAVEQTPYRSAMD